MSTNPFAAPFVQAVGGDLRAEVEQRQNPARIDQVWITMAPGSTAPVPVAANTFSKGNLGAGFDERVRAGILRGRFPELFEFWGQP